MEIINGLKDISAMITWPVAVLIIILLIRKNLYLLLHAITEKVKRPGKLAITKDGMTIEDYVEKKQDEVISMLSNTGKVPHEDAIKDILKKLLQVAPFQGLQGDKNPSDEKQVSDPDIELEDPVKNDPKFKGFGLVNNKRLVQAKVSEIKGSNNLYRINIKVTSTDSTDPLTGKVKFTLHPSYSNPYPEVIVKNGMAELNLISYGSFTFGVETDKAKLKMDLAEDVPGVSEYFKTH